MKSKILLLFFFLTTLLQAQTSISSTETISVTTAYTNNVSMSWTVTNSTDTNKPLLVKFNIATEYSYDIVSIYALDSDGSEKFVTSLSGIQNGSVSTVLPTGKAKITFTTDNSVCYTSSPIMYGGIKITFSADNNFSSSSVANTYVSGNSIINGNLGVGLLSPQYRLDVNGGARFTDNVLCDKSLSFGMNNRFEVNSNTIPNLRAGYTTISMPIWGFSTAMTTGSAEFWMSGDDAIRMFTSNNPYPRFSIGKTGNVGINTTIPNSKLEIVSGENSNPATANATQSGGALRLRGGDNAVLDFGMNSVNTWLQATDQLNLALTYNINLNPNGGNVGIGTMTPNAKLDVAGFLDGGSLGTVMGRLQEGNTTGDGTYLGVKGYSTQTTSYDGKSFSIEHHFYGNANSSINFYRGGGVAGGYLTFCTNNNTEKMRINANGNVSIGTLQDDPGSLLTVNGVIHAKEVKIDLTGPLADYVFDKSYDLMPLNKVEEYVNTNSHLPEMPSADEVKEKGMSMGEMQNKLLQKVEELTLYVIDLKKTNDAQNAEIKELKKQLSAKP